MKAQTSFNDPVADEQAALWAARIDGDTLDRAQRAELDAWLAQKPAHRVLLSQYCQFSADLEAQVPALVAAGGIAAPADAARAHASRRRWTAPRVAAVVLAAAAAIAVTFFTLRPAEPVQTFATAPVQRSTHTLADGTRIELNAQTSLRFENTKTERRVRLASGEALFTVAKDPARPFIVETPGGSVRVTGTTFNVRTAPSQAAFEVTVLEGSVQVRPSGVGVAAAAGPIALGAGDAFSVRAGQVERRALSPGEVDDALAWRLGQIVFRDVPLREAAARFAYYHGRAIHVAASVAEHTIGGRYSIDDLSGFLGALEAIVEVKATYDLSGAVTIGARPSK